MYFLWEVICVKIYYYVGNDCRELLSFKMASARGINGDIWSKNKNGIGCQFEVILENCKLLGFRSGLDRYLNNPPFKKGIHIATDPAFQQSNKMLETKLKDVK